MNSPLKFLIGVLASLLLCGGIFALGFWQGQRVLRQKTAFGPGSALAQVHAAQEMVHPAIPPNATPEMKEFLGNQETLSEKMEQLRNQGHNGALDPQSFAQFRQQNADLLARQTQLTQILAQQQAQANIVPPPALQIPPKAPPQLQAYLTARDKLMRDEIAFMNLHRADDLKARQAAMQQWRQQNQLRFQQLQQLSQALQQAKITP